MVSPTAALAIEKALGETAASEAEALDALTFGAFTVHKQAVESFGLPDTAAGLVGTLNLVDGLYRDALAALQAAADANVSKGAALRISPEVRKALIGRALRNALDLIEAKVNDQGLRAKGIPEANVKRAVSEMKFA